MRVLVTGGAGFIGSHIVEALVEQSHAVTITDTNMARYERNLGHLNPPVNIVWGDLGQLLQTGSLVLTDFDAIIHLSGNPYIPPSVENPAYDFERNLHTSFQLLEQLRPLGQAAPILIFASSAAVYGVPVRLPVQESDPLFPISPYGVSKLAVERYLLVYCRLYGLRGASLRFFSVYGPRQSKQVIYDLLDKLTNDPTALTIHGDGTQERDFCYVTDVVQAVMTVLNNAPLTGEAYNVASGTSHSIHDVLAAWCKILQVQPVVEYTGSVRAGETDKWSVNISALQALGYVPSVSFAEGLQAVKAWYDARS